MNDIDQDASPRRTSLLIGFATLGGVITGVLGLLGGLFALLAGQWEAFGMCLAASALAFGLLANAILRS